ncbi:hypothetical protein SAMN05446635_5460 [Burkholderia sp. OK233]|nr:hypothetical protein SAMN05446635_5460 [Burkholderia sp. OK233]
MTNPNSVKSFIGCYKISRIVQGLGTWYVYRQGDSLACKEMDYKDADVFAFYLGETLALVQTGGPVDMVRIAKDVLSSRQDGIPHSGRSGIFEA